MALPSTTASKNPKSPHRTLASLLKYFLGVTLTVELKNGRTYKGALTEADNCMNLTLDNASETNTHSNKDKSNNNCNYNNNYESIQFAEVSIRGSTIRYIHFPDDCDIPLAIKTGQDRERSVANKYQRAVRKSK
jgi:small nuclear ribonucleoprotein (snRNP)-like protein